MRTIFLVQPRQSGKTNKAIYEYLKDPENTIFVVNKMEKYKNICNKCGKSKLKNFISCYNFFDKIRDVKPKNIILDEYMFFKDKEEIYKEIIRLNPENIYVFTTMNKTYSKNIFEFVKINKVKYSYDNLVLLDEVKLNQYSPYEIYELYYNFITDVNTILIDRDFGLSFHNKGELRNILSEEQYDLEILNNYLI